MGWNTSRSRLLLQSTLPRDSRRLDAHVIRAIYCVAVFLVLLAVSNSQAPFRGMALMSGLTVIHSAVTVLLGVRLAGDVVGDRSSGTVGLLSLCGLSGRDILLARLASGLITSLSVWLVRIPFLLLAWSLGGIRIQQMLYVELLQLGTFTLTWGVGTLHAHYCPDRISARLVFVLPGLMDFLFVTPTLLLGILRLNQILAFPQLDLVVEELRSACVSRSLVLALASPHPSPTLLLPALLHLLLGGLAFYSWQRVYFRNVDVADAESAPLAKNSSGTVSKSQSQTRPSRPCWDDALAWQAYQYHSDGQKTFQARLWLGGLAILTAIGMACSQAPYPQLAVILLVILSMILMFIGQGKVSDCLQREFREKTLPALLTTPHSPRELCAGWGRGAWKLMLADLPVHSAALIAVMIASPMIAAPVAAGGMLLMLSVRPFLILSPLVPYSWQGALTGIGLVAIPILLVMISVPVSIHIHPWAGPVLLGLLSIGWGHFCSHMVTSWFLRKQETLE